MGAVVWGVSGGDDTACRGSAAVREGGAGGGGGGVCAGFSGEDTVAGGVELAEGGFLIVCAVLVGVVADKVVEEALEG